MTTFAFLYVSYLLYEQQEILFKKKLCTNLFNMNTVIAPIHNTAETVLVVMQGYLVQHPHMPYFVQQGTPYQPGNTPYQPGNTPYQPGIALQPLYPSALQQKKQSPS